MGKLHLFSLVTLLAMAVPQMAMAQAQGGDGGRASRQGFEVGGFIGNILPNQVPGVTEIHPQGGLRSGWAFGGGGVEFGVSTGKGEGVEWGDFSASVRMDVPVDTYTAMAYIGADVIRYQGEGEEMKIFGGGHLGGGLLVPLGGPVGFRLDMKFNVNPGTSLLISAGVSFLLGGESAGAGN